MAQKCRFLVRWERKLFQQLLAIDSDEAAKTKPSKTPFKTVVFPCVCPEPVLANLEVFIGKLRGKLNDGAALT
jgi:hypothetical protein